MVKEIGCPPGAIPCMQRQARSMNTACNSQKQKHAACSRHQGPGLSGAESKDSDVGFIFSCLCPGYSGFMQ